VVKAKKSSKVTYEVVRRLALKLSNVEQGTSYGTAALKVKGKLFVRLKEDGETIVLRMPFEQREGLMAEDPETYYITDHDRDHPWVLVRLATVNEEALEDLLRAAHRAASPKRRLQE
jgi:hypothetical protein